MAKWQPPAQGEPFGLCYVSGRGESPGPRVNNPGQGTRSEFDISAFVGTTACRRTTYDLHSSLPQQPDTPIQDRTTMDSSSGDSNSPTPSSSTTADSTSKPPATVNRNPNPSNSPPTGLIVFSHELPSGDVQDLLRRLHRHAKHPRHGLLARFLRECVAVLRQEVQALPRDQRQTIPPFADIVTLGSRWETLRCGPVGGAWEGAIVCLYQLAVLIGYVTVPVHRPRPMPDGGTPVTFSYPALTL